MSRSSVFLHYFLVEARPVWLFYGTVFMLIRGPSLSVYLMVRGPTEVWCHEPRCSTDMNKLMGCVTQGITKAMFSIDLHFRDDSLCTNFHGDNVLGFGNLLGLASIGAFIVVSIWMICKQPKMNDISSGQYLVFTKIIVKQHPACKAVSWCLVVYMGLLVVVGVYCIMFLVPESVLAETAVTRPELLCTGALSHAASYVLAVLTCMHLKDVKPTHFNPSVFFLQCKFKRSCLRTNQHLIEKLDHALLYAFASDGRELTKLGKLLQDRDQAMELMNCSRPHAGKANDRLSVVVGLFDEYESCDVEDTASSSISRTSALELHLRERIEDSIPSETSERPREMVRISR